MHMNADLKLVELDLNSRLDEVTQSQTLWLSCNNLRIGNSNVTKFDLCSIVEDIFAYFDLVDRNNLVFTPIMKKLHK